MKMQQHKALHLLNTENKKIPPQALVNMNTRNFSNTAVLVLVSS